jgi:hypothetical protein
MALRHINSLVHTTATSLVSIPVGSRYTAVQIYNNTGSTIFVGDATITSGGASIGNAIINGASVQIWLGGGDNLYAICATSPAGYVSVIYSD